jgi:hypothetical protein
MEYELRLLHTTGSLANFFKGKFHGLPVSFEGERTAGPGHMASRLPASSGRREDPDEALWFL